MGTGRVVIGNFHWGVDVTSKGVKAGIDVSWLACEKMATHSLC